MNTVFKTSWPIFQNSYMKRWYPLKDKSTHTIAMLPRLPISQCFLIYAWKWLNYMIKDTWLSACLDAFQGLNQSKQLGFIFTLITLWKSLIYKHICLTSSHSDLRLRSSEYACWHIVLVLLMMSWDSFPVLFSPWGISPFRPLAGAMTLSSPATLENTSLNFCQLQAQYINEVCDPRHYTASHLLQA